ncbi:gamma-glutamyl-gamma-aminobutyrate hydrolase family protein [Pseudofrankia sp. BMG5.36]|uniref:type 1 glutamine amidotransferase n=1 Tax=Pseudofrankia sp. BMG5.36 TaxID=1834512 RepID=UPI0009F4B0AF|nr:gamma-glutamyl-gamma-aminobutyrate hydrolase family protein [Pseudofrankia sp. BMG5.36]
MTTTAIGPGSVGHGAGDHGDGGGSSGDPKAIIVVHDVSGVAAAGELGTIADRMTQHGIRFGVITSGEQPFPDPAALDLIVVMGSDKSAYDDTIPWLPAELTYLRAAIRAGTPILGICFGGQILARALGGVVRPAERHELGWLPVTTADQTAIPTGPWMESHWDTFTVPPGARRLAWTPAAEQAFRFGPHLGVQFHPEITPTVFETWAAIWQANGRDRELAAMGVDIAALREEIARRSDASRTSSYTLFDDFWARARAFSRA